MESVGQYSSGEVRVTVVIKAFSGEDLIYFQNILVEEL